MFQKSCPSKAKNGQTNAAGCFRPPSTGNSSVYMTLTLEHTNMAWRSVVDGCGMGERTKNRPLTCGAEREIKICTTTRRLRHGSLTFYMPAFFARDSCWAVLQEDPIFRCTSWTYYHDKLENSLNPVLKYILWKVEKDHRVPPIPLQKCGQWFWLQNATNPLENFSALKRYLENNRSIVITYLCHLCDWSRLLFSLQANGASWHRGAITRTISALNTLFRMLTRIVGTYRYRRNQLAPHTQTGEIGN